MSDYGIIIKNNSGEVQIDSVYKNYALNQSGSQAMVGVAEYVNFTDVSTPPIFATKANASYYHCHPHFEISGSDYTRALILSEGAYTLYWKLFTSGQVLSLPSYGLVIRNSSNEIVFSSADTWLKIKGVYSRLVAYGATSDVTVVDADNNYFILTDHSWDLRSIEYPPYWDYYYRARGIKYINSTTIRIGTFIWQEGTVGGEITDSAWFNDCVLIEIGV